MPELPEVETVRRGLAPVMEDAVIRQVEQRRPDLRFPFGPNFVERLEGKRVVGLGRRAKYLLLDIEDGTVVIMHLGMSGSFRTEGRGGGDDPSVFHHVRGRLEAHDHVVFHVEGSAGPARIIYNDPRRFGFMLMARRDVLDDHPSVRGLGIEPVGNALSADKLANRFAGKNAPLKSILLDQKIIAGLGNIYVCEALWRSRLSPRRKARTLVTRSGGPTDRLVQLTDNIRNVIAEAIEAGGSSLRDHAQTDGSLGYFQHTFSAYDREGEACRHGGCSGTIARIVQSGRSTFFCPTCQR